MGDRCSNGLNETQTNPLRVQVNPERERERERELLLCAVVQRTLTLTPCAVFFLCFLLLSKEEKRKKRDFFPLPPLHHPSYPIPLVGFSLSYPNSLSAVRV
jgi:hypothetical protein